jgi:hypothetical protein
MICSRLFDVCAGRGRAKRFTCPALAEVAALCRKCGGETSGDRADCAFGEKLCIW